MRHIFANIGQVWPITCDVKRQALKGKFLPPFISEANFVFNICVPAEIMGFKLLAKFSE